MAVVSNDSVSAFVDKLIEQRGFLDITPEAREEIKNDILVRVDDFIAARVIAALSDEDVKTFEQMLKDNKSSEEVQQFVTTHVPDFNNFLTNVLMEFKDVYLGLVSAPPVSS